MGSQEKEKKRKENGTVRSPIILQPRYLDQ